MKLSVLIAIAIALPVLVFLALYLFVRSSVWFALRPRVWAVVSMIFAPLYVGFGVWEWRNGFETNGVLSIAVGVSFLIGGLYHWFRGLPVKLE